MKIVYQAYGRQDVLDQVYFSLVSLMARRQKDSSWSVLVYTDQPKFFEDFLSSDLVELRTITSEEIVDWAGPLNFVHRVKLCVLKDATLRAKNSLFYCDGDTVFLKDPQELSERIDDQHSVMHVQEYEFAKPDNPLAKKLRKFLKSHRDFGIDDSYFMWNAGVIGLSSNNFALIDDMISLSDRLHAAYPKHVMEQLAVSVVLQRSTQIAAADDVILHYWNQKPEYLQFIAAVRSKCPNLQDAVKQFTTLQLPQAPEPKKNFLQKWFTK